MRVNASYSEVKSRNGKWREAPWFAWITCPVCSQNRWLTRGVRNLEGDRLLLVQVECRGCKTKFTMDRSEVYVLAWHVARWLKTAVQFERRTTVDATGRRAILAAQAREGVT